MALVRIIEDNQVWLYGRAFTDGPLVKFRRDYDYEFVLAAIKRLRGV